MRGVLLAVGIVSLLAGCVDQTNVVGDERSRLACEAAPLLLAPPTGCTTISVESVDPYGCAGIDPATGMFREHAGSWIRLGGDAPASLYVTLTSCPHDGGSCTGSLTQRAFDPTPCTCDGVDSQSFAVAPTFRIDFGRPSGEVLLEPLGATFDVSLCAAMPGP